MRPENVDHKIVIYEGRGTAMQLTHISNQINLGLLYKQSSRFKTTIYCAYTTQDEFITNKHIAILQMTMNALKFIHLRPVAPKTINANPRLKFYQGIYFSTPKCSTLKFGKTLHKQKQTLISKRNFHQKHETKVNAYPGLS